MPDRNGDERSRRIAADAVLRRLQGAKQRERLEVDSGENDSRLLARVHVAVDQLAICDDEQDPLSRVPLLVDSLTEHLVVEHRLVDRNRQRLLGPEADRVSELLGVGDPRDLERADADPVVCEAESNAALRESVLREEFLQCFCKSVRIAQLAADDDSRREGLAGYLQELGAAVVRDARCSELGCADLQAGDPLGSLDAAYSLDLRNLLLALLGLLRLLRLGRALVL